MATNLAPSSLLNVTTATALTNRTCQWLCQHDLLAAIKMHLGTVPTITVKHDAGHIHRASPIHGLPPEGQQDTDKSAIKHTDNMQAPNGITKALLIITGAGLKQYTGKIGNQMSQAQSPVISQILSLIDLLLPPPPLDAKDGLEAVMSAIDAWFDYQDYLMTVKQLSQHHPASSDDQHHSPTSPGEISLDLQPEVQQCQGSTMDSVSPGIQREVPRAMRTQFVWKQGFLMAKKPSLHRQTKMLSQHCCTPPATNRHMNTPSNLPVAGNPTSTTVQYSTQSSFLQHYNLRLQLCGAEGAIYSEWESVTNFLLQLKQLDAMIEVLPWAVKDQSHNLPITINHIAESFFDLPTYVPGLVSTNISQWTRLELGDTRHSSLLLCSLVSPTQLVNNLGLWLRATRQGMWIRQLPLTKQTQCIGWLLYSVPEYPLDCLHRQIKQDTGIEVELHFHSILENGSHQADHAWPQTKAIHVDVDCCTQPSQLTRIKKAYLVGAKIFLLSIKMWLVPQEWRVIMAPRSVN